MNRRRFFAALTAIFIRRKAAPSIYSNLVSPGSDLNVENLKAALVEFERIRFAPRDYSIGFITSKAQIESDTFSKYLAKEQTWTG